MTEGGGAVVRDLHLDHRDAFVARGHLARHFFPHRVIRIPKGGPDGLKLARRMLGDGVRPDQLWELVLYALPPVLEEFPRDLFFDDDLVWHQQHLGLPGQVATGSVVVEHDDVYVPTMVADVVQRIGRSREHKTRVENRFKGWARLLVHAALGFAVDRGALRVHVAATDMAFEHTDKARDVQRPLFDRVYDGSVGPPFRAVRKGPWWVLDVADNAGALLPADVGRLALDDDPFVCVCHDIERGWGHLEEDPAFAARADVESPRHLEEMLRVESASGVRATYDIVGFMVPELFDQVRSGDHCIGFHSYDHATADEEGADDQLGRCRSVDYRLKGYRPAQSRLSAEVTDENLAFHNFEWLASSQWSLGTDRPTLANGVARLPILFDDFDLHTGAAYGPWEAAALAALDRAPSPVFSLHDCYGERWLGAYPELLRKLADVARFRTLDEFAAHLLLSHAE